MQLAIIESLGNLVLDAVSVDDMQEALAHATLELGFDRFALAVEPGTGGEGSILVHSYPASWAGATRCGVPPSTVPSRFAGGKSAISYR